MIVEQEEGGRWWLWVLLGALAAVVTGLVYEVGAALVRVGQALAREDVEAEVRVDFTATASRVRQPTRRASGSAHEAPEQAADAPTAAGPGPGPRRGGP